MNEKQELMDIYDGNKNKTGKIINRKNKNQLKENEFILSVHCWIINSKKEILITQRSMHKNRGGKWEDVHGGVRTGEISIDGMKRELKEELGLDIKEELEQLKLNRGSKFFNESMQDVFPKEDFYLCTEINKFNFILQVNKDENGMLFVKKIDV